MSVEAFSALPDWLRPPTWRWTAAMQIAASSEGKLPDFDDLEKHGFKRDTFLRNAARYYTIKYNTELGGSSAARVRYPNIYRAGLIFKGLGHYGYWKTILESMLLTELNLKQICHKLGIGEDINLIKTYRELFFDVKSYKNRESCIQLNLISTACRGDGLEPTEDYITKLVAYSRGFDAFYRMFISKEAGQISDEDAEWMDSILKNKLGIKAVNLASTTRTSYLNENLEILKTSKDWLAADDIDTDAIGNRAKSEALTELFSTMHQICDEAGEASNQLTSEQHQDFAQIDWSPQNENPDTNNDSEN